MADVATVRLYYFQLTRCHPRQTAFTKSDRRPIRHLTGLCRPETIDAFTHGLVECDEFPHTTAVRGQKRSSEAGCCLYRIAHFVTCCHSRNSTVALPLDRSNSLHNSAAIVSLVPTPHINDPILKGTQSAEAYHVSDATQWTLNAAGMRPAVEGELMQALRAQKNHAHNLMPQKKRWSSPILTLYSNLPADSFSRDRCPDGARRNLCRAPAVTQSVWVHEKS
jgi:hypothetical protein